MLIEPNDSIEINTIIESRDAIFDERRFTSIPKVSKHISLIDTNKEVQARVEEPRRSKRARTKKDYGPDFFMYLVKGTRESKSSQTLVALNIESDPKTYDEAMKSDDAAFWKEAINDEMDSMMGNQTWKLVDVHVPPGSKTIGCKWISKRK